MKIKPTYDYPVLIKKEQIKQHGLILLPETAQKSTTTGKVIAVHPECKLDIQEGDTIYFQENEGVLVEFNDEKLWAMKERYILAKAT